MLEDVCLVLFENLENSNICLFDRYDIPAIYPPSQVFTILSKFPLVDGSRVYGMPPDSDHHFRKFEEMQWKDTRFGRLNFTSIELKSVNVNNTVWYLVNEAEEVNKRFLLIDNENMEELSVRLKRQKSPDIMVIDSFQYTGMNYRQYIEFKERHRRKLLIFISHADGKLPNGRAAKSLMYDASLKIYVEGFRAFSKGRFIGPTGHYDIVPEKARTYWGEE